MPVIAELGEGRDIGHERITRGLAAASGRSLPAWIMARSEGIASNIMSTRPAPTSTTAGPLPR